MTNDINETPIEIANELPHLRRYARSLTMDRDDGDDLMQTAVERALARQHQFQEGTNLRRWLFTIVRNAHIDAKRKEARQGPHVPVEDWFHEMHTAPTQEKHIQVNDVADQIDDLRSEEKTVMEMSVVRGMRHKQIARELGVAVGTVKSRLSRARQNLVDQGVVH